MWFTLFQVLPVKGPGLNAPPRAATQPTLFPRNSGVTEWRARQGLETLQSAFLEMATAQVFLANDNNVLLKACCYLGNISSY